MPTYLPKGVRDELDALRFSNKSSADMAALDWEQRSMDDIGRLGESLKMPSVGTDVEPARAAAPAPSVFEAPDAQSLALPRRQQPPEQVRTVWKADDSQPDIGAAPQAPGAPAASPWPQSATPSAPTAATTPPQAASGTPAAMPSGDLEAWARSEARRLGIDPDTAVRVANTEGGFGDPTRQNTGGAPAYGPYQAYIGGPENPGLGDEMLARGIDPRNPAHARQAITYSLEHAAKNGWGAFQGAAANGIGERDGIGGQPAPRPAQTTPSQAEQTPQAQQQAGANWEVDQTALDDPDKWSLCGPVAAVMAATKRGGQWTVGQAKKIAVESGLWNADQGMGGLQTEVSLLNKLGVQARTGVADLQQLASDALAGNTPIISTVKHYFILKGYDPETGRFDTATSGSVLKGGSRWLTLDQIEKLGNGIQGAAYIDNPASPISSVASGGDMQKMSDTMPQDEPGVSPGDQKRTKLAQAASGQPQPMPTDASDGEAFVRSLSAPDGPKPPPLRNIVPYTDQAGAAVQPADIDTWNLPDARSTLQEPTRPYSDTIMQRQPLVPTQGADTATGDYVDLDQGPRESGYTLPPEPSSYAGAGDDQGYTGTTAGSGEAEEAPLRPTVGPAAYTSLADDPGGGVFAAQGSMSAPPQQAEQSSPVQQAISWAGQKLKPVLDQAGEVVAYVQAAPSVMASQQAGPVQSTPGEPDYVPPPPAQRWLNTPIQPPERPNPLVGPYDLTNESAFPTQDSRNRFTSEQAAADASAIPYQAAEATRTSVDEAIQSFADALRAGQEGRPLAAAGNALWGALQTAGLPWTVGQKLVDEMFPEASVGGVGPGALVGGKDILRSGIEGINALKNGKLGEVLSPENLARADDAVRAGAGAAGRGLRSLGEEGARQLMDLTPQPRVIQPGAGGEAERAARLAREQQIRSDYGNKYPDIRGRINEAQHERPLGEPSAEMLTDSRFPRDAVRTDPSDLSGPMSQIPDMRGRANAGLPFDPSGAALGAGAGAASEDDEGQQGDPMRTAGGLMIGAVGQRFPGAAKALQASQKRAANMARRGLKTPSAWEWLKAAGYSGIYSPSTAVSATVGGLQELVLGQPKEAIRALVERRPVAGAGSARTAISSLGEGFTNLGRVLLGDAGGSAAASGGSQGTAGLSDRLVNPAGHGIARALEKPGEILTEAPDAVFRPLFRTQGETREASRVAKEMGLRGQQASQYADQLAQDAAAVRSGQLPALPETQRVMDAGQKYADDLGFKGKPGAFGQWLSNQAKRDDAIGVAASFLMPFPGMAARMSEAAIKSTPGAALLPSVRKMYPSRFDMVYDQAFGAALATGIGYWAMNGGVTGSGPNETEKRAEMTAQGWQPNSTLVGGYYVPNRAFGRFQAMLDTAGELHDGLAYGKADRQAPDVATDLAKRVGKIATDQTGLSGLADLYDMLESGFSSQFPGWAARSITRYVPYGGVIRSAATALDATQRKPDKWTEGSPLPTIGENLKAVVPGLRQTLPAAQDVLGRDAQNPQQGLGAFIPKITSQKNDPVIRLFQDANVDIGKAHDQMAVGRVAGVALKPAEQRRWNAVRGQFVQDYADAYTSNAEFMALPPTQKEKYLTAFLTKAADYADKVLQSEMDAGDLTTRATDQAMKKAVGQ